MFLGRLFKSSPPSDQLLFLDVETTGFHVKRGASIVEICFFANNSGYFQSLIDPGRPIPSQTTGINGIDREMITGSPMFSSIASDVSDRMRGKIIVGHNVEFDLKFVVAELLESGITPPPVEYICTCKTDQQKHGMGGNRLHESLARRGVKLDQSHRAKDDVDIVRQLLDLQIKEGTKLFRGTFDMQMYRSLLEKEPEPMFPVKPRKRTTLSLRSFKAWGKKTDFDTINAFNRRIEAICENRSLSTAEQDTLVSLEISKKVAQEELKKALRDITSCYYENGVISMEEFIDLEEIANLFGFNNTMFLAILKDVVPSLQTVCFTNDLIIKGQVVDRYEKIFPWAIENGLLPSTKLSKGTDLVINCGDKKSRNGKITKAQELGVPVRHISEFPPIR